MLNRSQMGSSELLATFAFFLALFVFSTFEYAGQEELYYGVFSKQASFSDSLLFSESLVGSGGSPVNWTRGNVSAVGLAKKPGVLSQRKVDEFFDWADSDYEDLREEFFGWNFLVQIRDFGGVVLYETPVFPDVSAGSVFSTRRVAVLGNETVSVSVSVW